MSKKIKGQKLDLASFVGPNDPTMNLPTAPDPSRQRKDRKPREEFDNKERSRDSSAGWSRNSRGDDFNSQGNDGQDQSWRKGSTGRPFEGSERQKLNLLPRSAAGSSNVVAAAPSDSGDTSEDKWSKVFKNSAPDNSGSGNSRSRFAGRPREDFDSAGQSVFRRPREDITSFSLPTAPRAVAAAVPSVRPGVTPPVAKEPSVDTKSSKVLAKQEADKKAKEIREQQRQETLSLEKQARERDASAIITAREVVSAKIVGQQLLDYVVSQNVDTTGGMLVKAILESRQSPTEPQWWVKGQYGEALGHFLADSIADQVTTLYVIQEYCHGVGFPKIEVKGVSRRLIEVLFSGLLSSDLVDLDGFIAWADDTGFRSETSGRLDAIVQTTNFIQTVRHALETNYEDADDEEIDAPRETVK